MKVAIAPAANAADRRRQVTAEKYSPKTFDAYPPSTRSTRKGTVMLDITARLLGARPPR
jgi:hypothetical protein